MIRVIARFNPELPRTELSGLASEYRRRAAECNATRVHIEDSTVTMVFLDATDCTSAILSRLHRDDRVERINVEEVS